MITVQHFMILSIAIFFLAIMGCVCRKHLLAVLMFSHLAMLSAGFFFVVLDRYYLNRTTLLFSLVILIFASLSLVVGLAVWWTIVKKQNSSDIDTVQILKD